MKKVLAIVLALMMLIPMALAIVPVSAANEAPAYVDFTQRFNAKTYTVGSGFAFTDNYTAAKNANPVAGMATTLQYAGNSTYNRKDYDLSYNVKLSATNVGETMNFLYWQDYGSLANGAVRTFASEGKAVGVGLYTTYSGTSITYMILGYANAGFAVSKALVDGAASKTDATLLEGAPANAELNYNISFDYEAKTTVVTVTRVDDATKTLTMNFDLTPTEAALTGVAEAQGWAFSDYKGGVDTAVESISQFKIDGGDPIVVVQGFNCYNYAAKVSGFSANAENPLYLKNTATSGNQVVEYMGGVEYNKKDYEFSYEVETNIGASTYTHFYWQDWGAYNAASNRTYVSEGKSVGALLNIATTAAAGETPATVTFTVLGYGANTNYAAGLKGTKAEGSDELSNTTLLAGVEGTVKLLVGYHFDYAAKKLDVVVSRVDDPTIKTNVIFDLTNTFPALEAVTDPANVAITDAGATKVSLIGKFIFDKDGGVAGETEIEEGEWAYSADLAANTTDWDIMVPKAINREAFKVDNGYFTRTGTDSVDYADAYTMAKYKGHITSDYKLQFNIKLNADNLCRVATYLVWDDVDYWGNQKCNGFAFYVRVEEGKIHLVGVYYEDQRYKGSINPTPETAGNKSEGDTSILDGLDPNAEITVTYVVKGNKVSANVALASDPTKTTGTVIYDLEQYPNALAASDRTERFGILDAACESKIAPASIGQIKLWTTSEPPKDTTPSQTTPTTPTTPSTPNEPADATDSTTAAATTAAKTTAAKTTAAEEEKSGCGSSVTVASFAALATVAVSAVAIAKKRKED